MVLTGSLDNVSRVKSLVCQTLYNALRAIMD